MYEKVHYFTSRQLRGHNSRKRFKPPMNFLFHIPQYIYNPKISKFYWCLSKGFKSIFQVVIELFVAPSVELWLDCGWKSGDSLSKCFSKFIVFEKSKQSANIKISKECPKLI